MKISIAQKLRPFFHRYGCKMLLPKTFIEVQIFPTRIHFCHIKKVGEEKRFILSLSLKGPIRDFVAIQDLEKGKIRVSGKDTRGFFHYELSTIEQKILFHLIKYPKEKLELVFENQTYQLKVKEKFPLPIIGNISSNQEFEILSLGMHKKQNYEQLRERKDLKEIFPIWLRLSQLTPSIEQTDSKGTARLLLQCQELFEKKKTKELLQTFLTLWQVGFDVGMVPRLIDDEYQGVLEQKEPSEGDSPFVILHEGAKLIRSLFFSQEKNTLYFPKPPYNSGRFIHVRCGEFGEVDFEWRKSLIRNAIFRSHKTQKLFLSLPKGIKHFRYRSSLKEKGTIHPSSEPFFVEEGKSYLFDRFLG